MAEQIEYNFCKRELKCFDLCKLVNLCSDIGPVVSFADLPANSVPTV